LALLVVSVVLSTDTEIFRGLPVSGRINKPFWPLAHLGKEGPDWPVRVLMHVRREPLTSGSSKQGGRDRHRSLPLKTRSRRVGEFAIYAATDRTGVPITNWVASEQ
jgi:hypothetical protein